MPNTYRQEDGKLNKVIPPNAAPGGRRIRALVLQGNQLRFVIGSRGELHFAPQRTPMLFLYSTSRLGSPSVASGETVRAVGTNFLAASRSAGPVRISFDEKVVAERVPVRADGSFSVDIPVQHLPGEIQVIAEQQDGNRLTITTAIIDVIAQDTAQ